MDGNSNVGGLMVYVANLLVYLNFKENIPLGEIITFIKPLLVKGGRLFKCQFNRMYLLLEVSLSVSCGRSLIPNLPEKESEQCFGAASL